MQDNDTFTVTCLATPQHMEAYPADKNIVFDEQQSEDESENMSEDETESFAQSM